MTRIVRIPPDEWQRVRAIRIRALQDAPDAFARTVADAEALAPEEWRKRLTTGATFLATDGETDVGLISGAEFEGRENAAGLFSMWVAPEARGSGVGDLLVQAVIEWARESNYARVLLEVGDANTPAIRLYERNGFVPTGATGSLPPPREHIREHERVLEL